MKQCTSDISTGKVLLTRQEAAVRMGVSEDTLDRLRKRGMIAYIQPVPMGKVFITVDAIEEYLARVTHPARAAVPVVDTYRKRRERK